MRALEQIISAIGDPLFLLELRDSDGHAVAVGRWRHDGMRFKTTETNALRGVLNVGGPLQVCHAGPGQAVRTVGVAGFAGVYLPSDVSEKTVEGQADIVKIFVDIKGLAYPTESMRHLPPLVAADDAVRAMTVTAFVAARSGEGSRSRLTAAAFRHAACKFLHEQTARHRNSPHKGGLKPVARRRIEDLIEQRLRPGESQCLPPDVGELAAKAKLSVNHFIRVFREIAGATPHQYVIASRHRRALTLLGEPGSLVADVAHTLGFSSPAHFVASFRQKLGVTPGEYREAILSLGGPANAKRPPVVPASAR